MNTNESIALIAAVAALAFWFGKKQATKATANSTTPNTLDWLGSWSQA